MEHSQAKRQQRGRSIRLVADLFAAIVCAAVLDISLCRSVNAQSLVNPVMVSPTINTHLLNGTGFQQGQAVGCSTTAVVGNCCNTIVTMSQPFIDGAYQMYCSCVGAQTGFPVISAITGASTTTIFTNTCAVTAAVASCQTIQCIGWHP